MAAVLANQFAAGRQLVVDNIERLPVDTFLGAGEHDGFRAIVHEGVRQPLGST